ncbi:MAG: protein-disulfide reductase DsbD domain-containing protein, partial [Lacunisphaera sp.]
MANESKPVKNGAVEVSLVSDAATIEAGTPFTVALRMQHDLHWHSYWLAAGTGYPTSLQWTLPPGFKAGDIQWPTPHVLKDAAGKITGNGYSGDILLLVEITPPANLAAGSDVTLKAVADWLMCQEACMPGKGKLEINFPVAAASDGKVDDQWREAIAKARANLPKPATEWDVTATHTDKTATLRLTPKPGTVHQPTDLHFFSADAYTDYEKPETVTQENGSWVITMDLDAAAEKTTTHLRGVLASTNGWKDASGYDGLIIDAPFSDAKVTVSVLMAPTPPVRASTGLLGTLALAFVGGLILNLMPCVFPVLGIKILGFVNQSGHDRSKITLHGLVFALGVLISFWILAGALLVLRAGGSQLGWGFQLQSPAFVFCMAVFLLIFALNLSGLFEIGLSATGVGGKLQMKDGLSGSFFTGALAVLVATPCSAPFLAPALGAALSLPAVQSIAVFTAIAIGLALPYLLLSIFPQAIKFLPKPGAWMETFKQFMAFPL